MTITDNFIKSYSDRTYKHTTMVRHKGTVVALAMDDQRRIYYSVLDLNNSEEGKSPLDVHYWLENPKPLNFCHEIVQVGYGIVDPTAMPIVKKGSRAEAEPGTLRPEEIDPFLSTTARFTADAPLQALSDGKYIYIFRQSIDSQHQDMVYARHRDGKPVLDQDGNKVPVVNETLLVDRFVLAGTQLQPKMEVRYKRSRNKYRGQSNKDSLGAQDMEKKPFFEPTQELDFVRNLRDGRFSVLLLPTQIAGIQRWQLFTHNSKTDRIESFNVERSDDGLFNTKGTQFYTSPDPEYQKSVFERQPGTCPFTGQDLIPIVTKSGYAESALQFDGQSYINCGSKINLADRSFTVEFWAKRGNISGVHQFILFQGSKSANQGLHIGFRNSNLFTIAFYGNDLNTPSPYTDTEWHHWSCTYDSTTKERIIYCDGQEAASHTASANYQGSGDLYIGQRCDGTCRFSGTVDEVRIWNRTRSADEIKADLNYRLEGNEPGLIGYWQFDEGSGNTIGDRTENGNQGTISGNPQWVKSDAPIGDRSGIRRSSVKFAGRTIESGLSAILYYQQENAATGYDQQEKPIKKNARVMLAVATGEEQNPTEKHHIGVLDLAVSREGKLGQIPDNVALPLLSKEGAGGLSTNEALEQISNSEKKIQQLQGDIKQLEGSIQNITETLPGIDLKIGQLDQQIKNLQQELSKTQNLSYKVRTYTGDVGSAGTDADVYLILTGSLKASREFEIDNSANNFERGDWDYFGPFDNLGELGSLQQVRIRHNNSGAGAGWYLGKVEIDIYQGSTCLESLTFPCMNWLDSGSTLSRTLTPSSPSRLRDRVQIQRDIDQRTSEQNNLRNQKKELSALKDQQELSKVNQKKELSEQQKILMVLKGKLGDAVPMPMSILHIDPLGLTLSGGLLGFAYTKDTPQLFDSATGQLSLYFRGVDDQFFAAYYDTHTQKCQSLLPGSTGNLTFVARSAEPEIDESTITVSDGTTPETCTVKIQNSAIDLTETWNDVPREVEQFTHVINGTASEKIFIGSLAKDVFGIVTSLTLEKPIKYALKPHDILLIGDTQVQVSGAVDRNSTEIAIDSATVETAINTSVYLLPYDYAVKASSNKLTANLANGSLQFFAFPGNAQGSVKNGTATSSGATVSCQWVPKSPGKALAFDGQDDFVGLAKPNVGANVGATNSGAKISALQLNGSSDYVSITMDEPETEITHELWFKTTKDNVGLFSITADDGGHDRHIYLKNGNIYTRIWSDETIGTTGLNLADGQWHHVAHAIGSSVGGQQIYVDGLLMKSGTKSASNFNWNTKVRVGFSADATYDYLEGQIAEVRIWNRTRTQPEIQANMNQPLQGNESGLIGYWRFEAGIAKDYSGNGRDGTYIGNPQLVDSSPLKLSGSTDSTSMSALQFNGVGDKVDIPYKPELNPKEFTVEFWAKLTGGSGHRAPLTSRDDYPQRGYLFYATPENKWEFWVGVGSGWNTMAASSGIALNTWTHLAATLQGNDLKLYVNGKLEAQKTISSFSPNTARPLRFGAGVTEGSGDYFFNGQLDEVRFWNRARTQEEISAPMNQRLKGNESGLVGYWRFEAGIAKDYSGNGHDATYVGNPQLVAPAPLQLLPDPVDETETLDFTNQLAKLAADGDLTLETWVNPSAVTNTTRLIHHHSPNSKYTLGLQPHGEGYACFMGVGSQFKQSQEILKLGQWEHLALVYGQSYALQFNGSAYLSYDHSPTLDMTQDLTIEVFLQVDDLNQPRGILTKGQLDNGSDRYVPYSLYVDTDGKIAFAFEDKDGNDRIYKSTASITPGQFYKIAVTRLNQTETKNEGTQEKPNVKVNQWADIRFYINQKEQGYFAYHGKDPGGSDRPLELGKTYKGSQEHYFKGILSEVRLYNTALKPENLGSKIQGKEEGLISWWRLEENEGNIAYDAKSTNNATIKGAKWVKNPDPKASALMFYCNGSTVELQDMPQPPAWGEEQFTLGGISNGGLLECFAGTLEEVRIWKVARTQEQIQDNLFTRLKGEKEDLIANYTFDFDSELDSESQLQDYSLLGNHLILGSDDSQPTAVISTAPISDDIAQVRSALGGVKTQFHDAIHSRPAVQEYGDMQYDADGNLIGVHKRCYGYVKNGQWYLLTGYKVGNLVTEWVGQVQANPQIIGYIEGAPPVPSENLTSTSLKLGEFEDYNGCSAVELEEADSVNYIYASSKESGFDTAIDLTVQAGVKSKTLAGVGVVQEVSDVNLLIGGKTTLEYSSSSLSESSVSYGRNTTKTSRLELRGAWEKAGSEINPAVGRRFIPANKGFALVQSDTMDVFALRLAHNNALVSYRMQPNPDIPKDWNIITFPLNQTYTKQGTLDGKVGAKPDGSVQCDPDYPNATTYGQYSYFKPIEAYSLKKRIDREQQELETYYQQYETAAEAAQELAGSDVPKQLSSRNLVNTYVWTADGGFFSESTEVMESVQESTTGAYSFQGMGGVALDTNIAAFGGMIHVEMDALFGGHVETVKTKGKETEKSFGLTVEVAVDSDLQLYVNTDTEREKYAGRINEGGGAYDPQGNPVLRPGKVDAYRFMSFYLEPTKNNFEDFFNKVVDPMWLEQSDAPNAVALRQANQGDQKPKCWRIMHRVTYVSRILPEISAENASPVEKAMKAANVESNYELIKKLEPFVKNKTQDYAIFADAVRKTLKLYLPELQPHAEDIIQYAALYFGVEQEL